MNITEFLLARIAEDEAVAVAYRDGDNWGNPYAGEGDGSDLRWDDRFTAERVLAECEAKRKIVEDLALPYIAERRRLMNGQPSWGDEHPDLLLLLAMPYADHPDYDEAWR